MAVKEVRDTVDIRENFKLGVIDEYKEKGSLIPVLQKAQDYSATCRLGANSADGVMIAAEFTG